jgi:hypothetical protein
MKFSLLHAVLFICGITVLRMYAPSRLEENGFVSNLVPRSPRLLNPLDQRRMFTIYLPDGYDTSTERYPTIYYCPGLGGTDRDFALSHKLILDDLISNDLMIPTIVINIDPSLIIGLTPQGTRTYQGSWYVNSALNGQFETYIITQLIPFIDTNYRTIGSSAFRAIMGQSMGGFGSLYLGTKYPNVFCGFGSASGTPFWVFDTDLAQPGYAAITFNSLILPEIPTSGPNTGKIDPSNGINTFSVFSYSAAFSPNLSRSTPFAAAFFVDMPFFMNGDGTPVLTTVGGPFRYGQIGNPCGGSGYSPVSLILDPTIVAKWQTKDPYVLIDGFVSSLERQAIYLDAGNLEALDNVGAKVLSDKYVASAIDHEYVLFNGNHTTCLVTPSCSRDRTMFQLFSAKFASAGNFPDDIRTKLVGTGSIIINNGTWSIGKGTMVGIETLPNAGVSNTAIAITIGDGGTLSIGDHSNPGGALQVGNRFGKAIVAGDPSLATNTVSSSLTIDGDGAYFLVGKQGFFGIGLGIDGQAADLPNFWSINSLTNVQGVTVNINNGTFEVSQIPNGQRENGAIFGVGPSALYTWNVDPNNGTVLGGCSSIAGTDVWWLHPTLTDTTGILPSSGILTNVDTDPSAVDCIYLQPMGSTLVYDEIINRNVTATSGQYDDRGLPNNFSVGTTNIDTLVNFIAVENYLDQTSKEAALTYDEDDALCVAYVDNGSIVCVPTEEVSVGTDGSVDFSAIAQTSGTVGIWIETINGNRELILVYDIDPA